MGFSEVSNKNGEVGSEVQETKNEDVDYGDGDGVNEFDETYHEMNSGKETFEYQAKEGHGEAEDISDKSSEISEEVNESLSNFEKEKWDSMNPEEKKEAIMDLRDSVANDLGIQNKPEVSFYYNEDETDFGGYSELENKIYINEFNMGDATETVDTIAHESRHCWQHERAENPVTEQDYEFKENFDNYVSPDFDYDEYLNQPVEVDARDYASKVVSNIEKED